jgi:hypothetical protein
VSPECPPKRTSANQVEKSTSAPLSACRLLHVRLTNFFNVSKTEQREKLGGSMLVPSPPRLGIYR